MKGMAGDSKVSKTQAKNISCETADPGRQELFRLERKLLRVGLQIEFV